MTVTHQPPLEDTRWDDCDCDRTCKECGRVNRARGITAGVITSPSSRYMAIAARTLVAGPLDPEWRYAPVIAFSIPRRGYFGEVHVLDLPDGEVEEIATWAGYDYEDKYVTSYGCYLIEDGPEDAIRMIREELEQRLAARAKRA